MNIRIPKVSRKFSLAMVLIVLRAVNDFAAYGHITPDGMDQIMMIAGVWGGFEALIDSSARFGSNSRGDMKPMDAPPPLPLMPPKK